MSPVYECRLVPREFNSYGSRRGNDDVMVRGTFANIRLVNKFIGKAAPKTIHIPSNEQVIRYDHNLTFDHGMMIIIIIRWMFSMLPKDTERKVVH